MEGMDEKLAYELARRGIVTMEDLADQSVDDLLDIENLDAARAGQLIMTARRPLFAGQVKSEEGAADA
jgi:N utilization substance protein A